MRPLQGGCRILQHSPLLDERTQVSGTASIYAKAPDEQWSIP